MFDQICTVLNPILVIATIAGFGYYTARLDWYDAKGRQLMARIVNFSMPFLLFNSVTAHFGHDELVEMLKLAPVSFLTVITNYLIAWFLVKRGVVRREVSGTFIASFSSSTVLFIGIPLVWSTYGDAGIPFLLIYFFANCVFTWTFGCYFIQLEGVLRHGGAIPKLLSVENLKKVFSPPLFGFLLGVAMLLLNIPIPKSVSMVAKSVGGIASPLALIFIGVTVYMIGFAKLKRLNIELVLLILSSLVIRPTLVWLYSIPFDLPSEARAAFILSSTLPVTSLMPVVAKQYGASAEFASEVVGVTTAAYVFALPLILVLLTFI